MATNVTVKTYVSYRDGAGNEIDDPEVAERNIQEAASNAPDGAVSFEFYDQIESVAEFAGEQHTLKGGLFEASKTYFISGEHLDSEQVRNLEGNHTILLENMQTNRYDVLQLPNGRFVAFYPGSSELVQS